MKKIFIFALFMMSLQLSGQKTDRKIDNPTVQDTVIATKIRAITSIKSPLILINSDTASTKKALRDTAVAIRNSKSGFSYTKTLDSILNWSIKTDQNSAFSIHGVYDVGLNIINSNNYIISELSGTSKIDFAKNSTLNCDSTINLQSSNALDQTDITINPYGMFYGVHKTVQNSLRIPDKYYVDSLYAAQNYGTYNTDTTTFFPNIDTDSVLNVNFSTITNGCEIKFQFFDSLSNNGNSYKWYLNRIIFGDADFVVEKTSTQSLIVTTTFLILKKGSNYFVTMSNDDLGSSANVSKNAYLIRSSISYLRLGVDITGATNRIKRLNYNIRYF